MTTPRHDYALIGFLAAVVHSLNHSVMKSLLFMSAGAVMHATDSKDIEKMGGLGKLMPWTAVFYTGRFDGFVCPASDRWFCGGVARTAEFCYFGRQQ